MPTAALATASPTAMLTGLPTAAWATADTLSPIPTLPTIHIQPRTAFPIPGEDGIFIQCVSVPNPLPLTAAQKRLILILVIFLTMSGLFIK